MVQDNELQKKLEKLELSKERNRGHKKSQEKVQTVVIRKWIDWKNISVAVTACLAVAGFVWNKAEGCVDRMNNRAVQEASYKALAGKVDTLFGRMERVEQALIALPSLFDKKRPDAKRLVEPMSAATIELTPPGRLFVKSGLPKFEQIQDQGELK